MKIPVYPVYGVDERLGLPRKIRLARKNLGVPPQTEIASIVGFVAGAGYFFRQAGADPFELIGVGSDGTQVLHREYLLMRTTGVVTPGRLFRRSRAGDGLEGPCARFDIHHVLVIRLPARISMRRYL